MSQKTLKNAFLLCMLAAGVALGACTNTVHGAGRDIENAGEAVQDTVE